MIYFFDASIETIYIGDDRKTRVVSFSFLKNVVTRNSEQQSSLFAAR